AAIAMAEAPRAGPLREDRRAAAIDRVGADPGQTVGAVSAAAGSSAPTMQPSAVRDLMWESAGLFRTREGLMSAVTQPDAAYAADLRVVEAGKVAVRESGARGSYATAT